MALEMKSANIVAVAWEEGDSIAEVAFEGVQVHTQTPAAGLLFRLKCHPQASVPDGRLASCPIGTLGEVGAPPPCCALLPPPHPREIEEDTLVKRKVTSAR